MRNIKGILNKFWSLEGIVAIILSIFALNSFFHFHILGGILTSIFAYWFIRRTMAKPTIYGREKTDYNWDRELDL